MIRRQKFSGFQFRDVRCLVVDDEGFSRGAVQRILQNLDCHDVEAAAGGRSALDIMSNTVSSFDIVLCDFEMPGMNGLEVLKSIRMGVPGVARDTPFIMLTNHSERYIVATAFQLDVDCFIRKPASAPKLRARITRILTTERPIRERTDYLRIPLDDDDDVQVRRENQPHPRLINLDDENPKPAVNASVYEIDDKARPRNKEGQAPEPFVNRSVKNINVGDRLAEDLITPSGQILLRHGQIIDERMQDRLLNLGEIGVKFGLVKIVPAAEEE